MKTLVTGANGFLGRRVVDLCRQQGWETHLLTHRRRDHLPSDCRVFDGEELDALDADYDLVVHAAAQVPYGAMHEYSGQLWSANLALPLALQRRLSKAKRSVVISSVSVYATGKVPIREDSPLAPTSAYAWSKLATEIAFRFAQSASIVRFTSIYGPDMEARSFLPVIVDQARRCGEIVLFGDGSRRQDYLHVRDAARLAIKAGLRGEPGAVYLGTSGRSYSNLEVGEIVRSLLPETRIRLEGDDPSASMVFDNARTRATLGFEPAWRLEAGIEELIRS